MKRTWGLLAEAVACLTITAAMMSLVLDNRRMAAGIERLTTGAGSMENPAVQKVVAAWDELTTPPTVAQLQQMLVMRGCDIRIDGRLGPETIRAWQQWECDAAAVRAMGARTDAAGLEND